MNKAGKEYGIGHLQKFKLARRVMQNNKKIKSLTRWQQQLLLIGEILAVPKSLKGDVVECGCFSGATTVSLSLACALTNRRLFACDSFEGLPTPREDEKYAIVRDSNIYYYWQRGEYASEGGLDGVKKNIREFGNIKVCQFVKGYFCDTLKDINTDSIVLVFEDADMVSSVEDCLRHLWPKLQEGCKFYCHEPGYFDVVALFFDKHWWKKNLKTNPPGFFGSGYGVIDLEYGIVGGIGYAKKLSRGKIIKNGKRAVHLGTKDLKDEK